MVKHWDLKVQIAVLFFGYGSMAYLALFYDQVMKFTPVQIGMLTSLSPVISFFVAPQFMFIADKYGWHKRMLIGCAVVSSVAAMMYILLRDDPNINYGQLLISTPYLLTVAVSLFYAIPFCAISPLMDTMVLGKLKQRSGKMDEIDQKQLYGKQRWVGSITYGLSAFIMGYIYNVLPRMSVTFIGWTVLVGGVFVATLFIPDQNEQVDYNNSKADKLALQKLNNNDTLDVEKSALIMKPLDEGDLPLDIELSVNEIKPTFLQSVRALSENSEMVLFWAFALVQGLGQSVVNNFLNIMLVQRLNASDTILAFGSLNRVILEAPFFFFNGAVQVLILKCLGLQNVKATEASKWVMILSMMILCFRTLMYALLSFFTLSPYIDLAIELLHGVMYATFYGSAVQAAASLAPKQYQGTSQGIFSAIYSGLGPFVGSILGGYIYNQFGSGWMFLLCSLLCFVTASTYALNVIRNRV
ncbi:hypothetical protein MP228_002682 [Amoeboaphelidium protococcarum]|nr:hypothetical protein MP228_002682 [Amoeboaphelidium protococcarum]